MISSFVDKTFEQPELFVKSDGSLGCLGEREGALESRLLVESRL